MVTYQVNLYHRDADAPTGMGRALRKGDKVCNHVAGKPAKDDPRRWTLLADPVRSADGYHPQNIRALYEGPSYDEKGMPYADVREVPLYVSGFSIVGIGTLGLAP